MVGESLQAKARRCAGPFGLRGIASLLVAFARCWRHREEKVFGEEGMPQRCEI